MYPDELPRNYRYKKWGDVNYTLCTGCYCSLGGTTNDRRLELRDFMCSNGNNGEDSLHLTL